MADPARRPSTGHIRPSQNPFADQMRKGLGLMAYSDKRRCGGERVTAGRWERLQLLATAMRLAELLLDLWRDHLI
jgi:hypothetical protein